eukprot:752120_1
MSTYMAHTCTQCKKNTCKKKKGSVYYKQCDTCRAQHRNWKAKRNKTSIVEHVCVYKSSCGNKTSLRVYKSNTNTQHSSLKTWKTKGRAVAIVQSPKITWKEREVTGIETIISTATNHEIDSVITQKDPEIDLQCTLHGRNDKSSHSTESMSMSS